MHEKTRQDKKTRDANIIYVNLRQAACILVPGLLAGFLFGWWLSGNFTGTLRVILIVLISSLVTVLSLNIMAIITRQGLKIGISDETEEIPPPLPDKNEKIEESKRLDNQPKKDEGSKKDSGLHWSEIEYPDPDQELAGKTGEES